MAFDCLRIGLMAVYIIINTLFVGEDKEVRTIFSLLNFVSWISLIKYVRRISGVRGFISLIFNAIEAMMSFLVIVFLFMIAFATSI